MKVPARSAAAMSISPFRPLTSRPSRVKDTVSTGASAASEATGWSEVAVATVVSPFGGVNCSLIGAASLLDVDQELVGEHLDGRPDRRGDRRPEHADGGLLGWPRQTGGDVVAGVEEEVKILLPAVAGLDALHDLLQPAGSLATGGALAARLPEEELGDPPGRPYRAGVVVHDHDRPRPEHRPGRAHLVLTEGQVDLVRSEPRGRHASGDERLQLASVGDAAAEHRGEDQVVEGGLDHLQLEHAGVVDVAGQREQAGAGRPPLAEGGEGRPAV